MALQVTTRADRQRERIARLLDQAMSAADAWVQATYAWGSRDGRGVHSAHVTRQRDLAERRFRDVAAKLVAAVTPARRYAPAAAAMTPRRPPDDPPRPVWPPYGDYPLPTAEEALQASLRAFPSWFLRIECDRCGKVRMLNQAQVSAGQRNMSKFACNIDPLRGVFASNSDPL